MDVTARVAAGIAIVLVLIAVLALAGHESVVDRGVNYTASSASNARDAIKGAAASGE